MTHPLRCEPARGRCQFYHPGHNLHSIHASHVGSSPWGWRDAVVTAVEDCWLTLHYALEDASVRLWHHDALHDLVEEGDPLRVHEGLHVLGGPFGWLNVIVEDGLGPVSEPVEKTMWADEVTGGVQDLTSGRALALDHYLADDRRST